MFWTAKGPADQEPQGEASQLSIVQVTPEFVGSFVTVAIIGTLAFVSTVLGGACVMLIETEETTMNVAEALTLLSAVALAVRVTVLPTMLGKRGSDGKGITNVAGEPGAE
jgi:hypothetical protein